MSKPSAVSTKDAKDASVQLNAMQKQLAGAHGRPANITPSMFLSYLAANDEQLATTFGDTEEAQMKTVERLFVQLKRWHRRAFAARRIADKSETVTVGRLVMQRLACGTLRVSHDVGSTLPATALVRTFTLKGKMHDLFRAIQAKTGPIGFITDDNGTVFDPTPVLQKDAVLEDAQGLQWVRYDDDDGTVDDDAFFTQVLNRAIRDKTSGCRNIVWDAFKAL